MHRFDDKYKIEKERSQYDRSDLKDKKTEVELYIPKNKF